MKLMTIDGANGIDLPILFYHKYIIIYLNKAKITFIFALTHVRKQVKFDISVAVPA